MLDLKATISDGELLIGTVLLSQYFQKQSCRRPLALDIMNNTNKQIQDIVKNITVNNRREHSSHTVVCLWQGLVLLNIRPALSQVFNKINLQISVLQQSLVKIFSILLYLTSCLKRRLKNRESGSARQNTRSETTPNQRISSSTRHKIWSSEVV